MAQADEFIRSFGIALPPFVYWTPDEMRANADIARAVLEGRMRWDITDYGQGNFDELGLFLFMLSNGRLSDLQAGGGMCYAEKLLISKQDQISPMHRHHLKAEDTINRGGAAMAIELKGSVPDGSFDPDAGGVVMCDGTERRFDAGKVLLFAPGESVTLMLGDWHNFGGEGGDVLIGEVSTVSNYDTGNWFRECLGRFAAIDEDVAPTHLSVSDYGTWL